MSREAAAAAATAAMSIISAEVRAIANLAGRNHLNDVHDDVDHADRYTHASDRAVFVKAYSNFVRFKCAASDEAIMLYAFMDWYNFNFAEYGSATHCADELMSLYTSPVKTRTQADAALIERLGLLSDDTVDGVVNACEIALGKPRSLASGNGPDDARLLMQRILLLRKRKEPPRATPAVSRVATSIPSAEVRNRANLCACNLAGEIVSGPYSSHKVAFIGAYRASMIANCDASDATVTLYASMDWYNFNFTMRGVAKQLVDELMSLYEPATVAQADTALLARLDLLRDDVVDGVVHACEIALGSTHPVSEPGPNYAYVLMRRILLLHKRKEAPRAAPVAAAAIAPAAAAAAMQRQMELAHLCASATTMNAIDMAARLKRMLAQVEKEISDAVRARN